MTKLLNFFRQVHRLFVLLMLVLALTMSLTGLAMKYPRTTLRVFPTIDFIMVRYIHNQLSLYFSMVLGMMVVTGVGMYIVQPIIRRRAKQAQTAYQRQLRTSPPPPPGATSA